jgi:hypothetical protein
MQDRLTSKRGTWRQLRRLLPITLGIAVALLMGSADAWAKGNFETPPPVASVPSPAEQEARSLRAQIELAMELAEAARSPFDQQYGEREKQAQALEAFQGGDYIVIGGSALGIVLIILLILIIL